MLACYSLVLTGTTVNTLAIPESSHHQLIGSLSTPTAKVDAVDSDKMLVGANLNQHVRHSRHRQCCGRSSRKQCHPEHFRNEFRNDMV